MTSALTSERLARAANVVIWNRWFMTVLGLWPTKVNQPLFVFCSVYTVLHCTMGARHLIKYIDRPDYVIANLVENVVFFMMLGKLLVCRRSCGPMAEFLGKIEDDFSAGSYANARERTAYLRYNEYALTFIKYLMGLYGFTAVLFYFKTFLGNWSSITSGNFSYQLPYQVYPFFEIEDTTTYVCVCLYQMIAVPILICGYVGPNSWVLSFVLHICGQFAALSSKVDDLLKDRENCRRHTEPIVLRHRHLIELAEILENNFNMIFLLQTLGTMFLLCLTSYNMIANSEYGEDSTMIIFFLYTCCVCSEIFGFCYIGECLIAESGGLRDTFYNSDWYNKSTSHAKFVSICMTRTEKPLVLTAGKFCILSLNTFTSIVKTSMAYLSMLRNFT